MKKLILAVILAVYVFNIGNAQQEKIAPEGGGGGTCPAGQCPTGVTIHITAFNFHKPRTDCESGFGLCIKGYVGPLCGPCQGASKASLTGDDVNGWYSIKKDKLELHLPASLQKAKNFENTDMNLFELEDRTFMIEKADRTIYAYVRGGRYPVKRVDDELVITLNLVYN